MRRLPIYFLIDVSESMIGDEILQVEEGIATIIQELKKDPTSIETVWISVIVFAGQAKTIIPLQEIISFYPPKFPIGSGTYLSRGLGHLMYELRKNIVKTTLEKKGDWKPIIFLFTDGVPTDNPSTAIEEWKKEWAKTANMVAISFGDENNTAILDQLTDNVLLFKNTDSTSYQQFFKWVTDSIKMSSMSIQENKTGFELADINNDTFLDPKELKNKPPIQYVDENFVVITGICQNSKRPYLIKYKKEIVESSIGYGLQTRQYRLKGSYALDHSYSELSAEDYIPKKINTEEIVGVPTCPSCGNQIALAMCTCGTIHCINTEKINSNGTISSSCPSCNMNAEYGFGDSGFDINRAQG